MKRTIYHILALALCITASQQVTAQPKKSQQATFTLNTYKSDGTKVATAYGCFIGKDGSALSGWTPFKGADSAVVVLSSGKTYQVDAMLGANELYDIAKFRVADATAVTTMPLASSAPSASSKVWVVTPTRAVSTPVSRVEKFMNKYNYYVLGSQQDLMNHPEQYPDGSPVTNDKGELVGIFNNESTVLSATDYHYNEVFVLNGLSVNDPVLKGTTIRKALPSDLKNAQLALMLAADSRPKDYMAAAREFIGKFPTENDGYYSLATLLMAQGKYAEADQTLQESVRKNTDKALAHHNYSRLILQAAALKDQNPYPAWSMERAIEENDEAIKAKDLPIYQEQRGKILYAQGKYQEAYDKFISLTNGPLRNAELFLEAMQSKEQLKAPDSELLELLNSAVAECDTPYTVVSAPYFLARGLQYEKMGRYRESMVDLYRYESLNYGRLNAEFYYHREQMEVKGKLYQNALNDINLAIALAPRDLVLWCEKANLHLRVNQLNEAIMTADYVIKQDDTVAAAYLIRGIAKCENKQKTDGLADLNKAKSLGDEQADTFIKKYK